MAKGSTSDPTAPSKGRKNSLTAPKSSKAPKRAPTSRKGAKTATPAVETAPPSTSETGPVSTLNIVDVATGEPGVVKVFDLTKSARKHYSHSFIKGIGKCSAVGYFRMLSAPKKKVFALERGSVVHNLLEAFQKFGKDPIEGLPDMWRQYILDNAASMSEADREKIEKGYEETKLMLEEWLIENRSAFAGRVKPEDVEVEFTLPITMNVGDHTFTRNINGKIDLVLWNEDRSKYYIIDYKTSASAPKKDELAQEAQFALYQYAATQLFGKKPSGMTFYLLKGEHGCNEKFSSKAHPRDPLKRVDGCWINYSLKVPLFSDERIQELFDLYYAPIILKYEAGIFGKEGRADYKNQCARCEYKETCDATKSFPAPFFV